MGFLRNNNAADAFAPPPVYRTPGIGDGLSGGTSLDDIIAAGNGDGANFLQAFKESPAAMPAAGAPRKRMSTIDMIGRIADTLASVGGADPLYQRNQDAATERQRAATSDEWQQKFNGQKFQSGANELQDFTTKKFAQASRGLNAVLQQSGVAGVTKAWPLISKQLGFSDEEAKMFGDQLAQDPEGTLTALDEGLNGATGSSPKELTIYKMLQRQDPTGKAASDYLERVAAGNTIMTPYQEAQIDLRRDQLRDRRISDRRNYNLRDRAVRIKENAPGKGGAIDAGAADNFRSVTRELRTAYDNLHKSGAMVDPNQETGSNIVARARASGVGQLVEGALGTTAQTERDKITGARPALMQAIVKATGMSAKQIDSNAEMKLMLQQATDPTMSYQANMAALKRLEGMVANLSKGSGGSSAPRKVLKPRAAPGKSSKPSVSNW